MKTLLLLIISIHSLIHLFGFAKAFNLSKVEALTLPISKPLGVLWGFSFLLFALTALLYSLDSPRWWLIAFISIFISQVLILYFWKDAKYGTLANIIILVVAIIGYAGWSFEKTFKEDVNLRLERTSVIDENILKEKDLFHLPAPVKSYLRYVGVVNKPQVKNALFIFEGEMRGKNRDWFKFTSEQYNFFDEPERLFFMKAKISGLPTYGYHAYKNREAKMQIKLLSLFPIANILSEELFRAETVTVFNDMCLLAPATLIDDRIKWKPINNTSVKAVFTNQGISISATLYFNEKGQLINFISDDRFDVSDKKQYRFSTPVTNYQKVNGYNLCSYGEAIRHYPEGKFVYGKFYIKNIVYNTDKN
jgi:uncharacterized protein DUF6544